MMTLPITLLATGNNVTPRQFLHSFGKSPRFGIFTIKPFFHWSGTFSSCHILLNSLVNSFTATSLSALYSSAGIPSIPGVLPLSLCLLQCLPHFHFPYLCCIHLTNFVCLYFVFFDSISRTTWAAFPTVYIFRMFPHPTRILDLAVASDLVGL